MPFAPRQRGSPVRWRYSGRSNPTNALRRSAATLGATLTADDMRSGRWLDDATRLDGGMQRDGTVRIQRQIQSLGLRLRTAIHAAARGVNLLYRTFLEIEYGRRRRQQWIGGLGEWSGFHGDKLATYRIACAFCGEKGNFETVQHLQRVKPGGSRKTLNYDTLKCGHCGNYMFAFWSAAGMSIGGGGIHGYRTLPRQ